MIATLQICVIQNLLSLGNDVSLNVEAEQFLSKYSEEFLSMQKSGLLTTAYN